MKKSNPAGYLGLCIGLGLILWQVWTALPHIQFLQRAVETTATIVQVDETTVYKRRRGTVRAYIPTFTYNYTPDRAYTVKSIFYEFSKDTYPVGTETKVLYDPEKPEYAILNTPMAFFKSTTTWSFAGFMIILSSLLGLYFYNKKMQKLELLEKGGVKLEAVIEEIYTPLLLQFNANSLYKIIATATYEHKKYRFVSHLVSGNKQDRNVGERVDVLIEKDNPNIYIFDL